MARLVIITHEFDVFLYRNGGPEGPLVSPYLLTSVLGHLDSFGHSCVLARGRKPVGGDIALLHVDSTIVDDEYLALGANYAATINFGTADISKRRVSRALLAKGDSWNGQVIVKANLNSGGNMEDTHNQIAAKLGFPQPHPGVTKSPPYQVLKRLADVPDVVWDDPTLVVEKFIPEADPAGGFALHTWVFMGSRERCTRMVTENQISKAGDVLRYAPVEVPPKLRKERERLGFDYGKFDFVMHDGAPVLLDANRTPGFAQAIMPLIVAGAPKLAEGLDELIRAKLTAAEARLTA